MEEYVTYDNLTFEIKCDENEKIVQSSLTFRNIIEFEILEQIPQYFEYIFEEYKTDNCPIVSYEIVPK